MNNPSLHSLFYSQHCLIFNWIFSVFSFQMLGVDLPFSAKLKSLLAPGSFAVKGLTVIKSLLVSPGLVLLNEAVCFPSAPHLMRPPFLCFSEQKGCGVCFAEGWSSVEGPLQTPPEAKPWNQTKHS